MKKRLMRSILSIIMALAIIMTGITVPESKSYAAETAVQSQELATQASSNYGLLSNAKDGVILHCWNWSYNSIKDTMAEIAAAGYTSVQTSPVQRSKEYSQSCTYMDWWKVYQPTTIRFANDGESWFGTKAEFKAMCDEAEKYGIKVIVDIVANHMANNTGSAGNCRADIYSGNDAVIRDDDSCWHLNGSTGIDYGYQHRNGDTSSLTWGFGGWPDLNTANKKVQNAVVDLLKECVDLGADGFRFDAAKHIELPTDPGGASDFWPYVTDSIKSYATGKGVNLYLYGEILDDSATSISNYTKYIAVTDNRAGNDILDGVTKNDIGKASNSSLNYNGENGDNLVLWAESHDTYANNKYTGTSTHSSQDQVNRTWAIVAARDFASLYYIRPSNTSASMGTKSGNTSWKNKEVSEVNKFHNAFSGQKEYMSSSDGSVAVVERGTTGVVLVNIGGGSKSVNAKANLMKDGTYIDQVSGSTFTVSGGRISGNIGSTGIAVVYNPEPIVTEPTASITPGTAGSTYNYSTDSLTLTLKFTNATSGSYSLDGGAYQTYTNGQTIVIGAGSAYGTTTTVAVKATDGTSTSTPVTYTYSKVEKVSNIAYLDLPSGWGTDVYCYAYDSATELVNNGTWPGVKMTLDSATGYYKYEIPDIIKAPRVIFYNSDTNRAPVDMEKGYLFETDGSWVYTNGTWKILPVTTGKVEVNYVNEAGTSIAASKTLTGNIGATYTTTAATVDGYILKTTPANATGTYTSSTITVTYVYSEVPDDTPKVTTSLATGSKFTTETKAITLTLSNAVSGTYSVDNGPVKTFTSSANVTLGQGKVADSVVTVKATATSSAGVTKDYEFTYNKKFNGTVNEAEATAKTYLASSSTLASAYSTSGIGKNETITVDGNISDWSNAMIIAQGTANDDPRVYRDNSMYEVPIDMYTLYGAWDNDNLYLMWEMTNVQDVVAPNDNYPLSQGILYQTMNVPFYIAVDTGNAGTRIGNGGKTTTGDTLWDSDITIASNFNKIIAVSTNGANGPYVYGGDSTGINTVEEYTAKTSGINFKYGLGILSSKVTGINGAYGANNNRVVGDVCNNSAAWVDFNSLGHSSSTMDFHYEMSIPLSTLGVTASDVTSKGLGVLVVATLGKSGMDCLPYDTAMNDNADLPDTGSQEFNSYEKSDADNITTSFARVAKSGGIVIPDTLELNSGADRSSPQSAGTALTLNGIAKGGTAPYTYKYYVNNSLVGTQSGSGATSAAWTPAAGSYVIKCVVTDAAGTSVTSTKNYVAEASGNTKLNITASTNKTSAVIGDKVTITGTATGGTGSYTYSYLIHNTDTDAWSRVTDFSSSNTYTWAASSAGNREFYVEVKDGAGTVVRSTAVKVNTTAVNALALKAESDLSVVKVGNKVTITGTATGGTGSYTYSYLIHNTDTGAWSRVTEFISSNTYTWTASSAGNREFYVEVKDGAGTVVRSPAVKVKTIDENKLSLSAKASASTVSVGKTVMVTGTATGGTGSYTYSYLIHNTDTDAWCRLTDFISSSTYTWFAGSAGNREFYVEVKDDAGTVVRSSAVKVAATSDNKLSIIASATSFDLSVGSKTTIIGTVIEGAGSYTYSYLIHNTDTGAWSRVTDFISSNTFTWTASSAGNREFYVEVKDATGTVARSSAVNVVTK